MYEVGAGSDAPGLDDQLRGAKPGDILEFSAPAAETRPVDEPPGSGSGETTGGADGAAAVNFRVLVKGVKEKVLPEPTDEWAAEASEFDTVDELRDDLRRRLRQVRVLQAQLALRDRALEALVALVVQEPPEVLVEERDPGADT